MRNTHANDKMGELRRRIAELNRHIDQLKEKHRQDLQELNGRLIDRQDTNMRLDTRYHEAVRAHDRYRQAASKEFANKNETIDTLQRAVARKNSLLQQIGFFVNVLCLPGSNQPIWLGRDHEDVPELILPGAARPVKRRFLMVPTSENESEPDALTQELAAAQTDPEIQGLGLLAAELDRIQANEFKAGGMHANNALGRAADMLRKFARRFLENKEASDAR